jgi:hypothetical protein
MSCPYPYTQVTAMEEHYSDLVKSAKTRKEKEEVMRGWFYWKGLLIKYFAVFIILFSLSSCKAWKIVCYGRDNCDKSQPRQMERGHLKPETRLGY